MAIIVNSDLYSNIFVWQVSSDICELVFKINLRNQIKTSLEDKDIKEVEIASVELFFKLKALVVTTLDNRIMLISPQMVVKEIKFDHSFDKFINQLSCCHVFEHNKNIYISLGFSNGKVILEDIKKVI